MDIAARFREYVRLNRKRVGEGLTPAELNRFELLRSHLTQHFDPDTSGRGDTRRSVRVPTRLKVSFANEGDLARCLMTNMNRHGVFVETDHPQEIGSRFDLRIHIDVPALEITAPVAVVSVGLGPGFEAGRRGMGLRFLEAEPEVQRQLEELYERAFD